jgi:hypothetical protein
MPEERGGGYLKSASVNAQAVLIDVQFQASNSSRQTTTDPNRPGIEELVASMVTHGARYQCRFALELAYGVRLVVVKPTAHRSLDPTAAR